MSQSTFSKVFRKSFSMGEPEETRPSTKDTRPAVGKPAPRARALPPVRVLYVTGETREITFVTGTFDKVYPHLVLDFPVSLAAVPPLLEREARHEAVVVGWSVPEVEALTLIGAIRERQPHMAIVAVGERSPDMSLTAGADEFVQRDATMLTRLPVAIEESVRKQQERAALAPAVQVPPASPAPGDLETPALPSAADAPSEDLPGSPTSSASPEQTTGRAATPRMALIGDLDRAREAVAAAGVALDLVPITAVADGAKCAAVVIDQSHLSVDATQALSAARAVSLPTILLYDPEAAESVIRAFAGDADELVAKETGWARQVVLRLNLALARHRRSLELASLKAREGRLRAAVETLPAAVLRLSPEGTILAANTVAVSLLGATESRQLLRKQFYSLVNPADRDLCIEGIGRVYAGESRSIEVWATTLSGESRALQLNAIPVAADGGAPASVLTVLRDVTDRKRLEMALELAAAAPLAAAPTAIPAPAPTADQPAAQPVAPRDPVAPPPDAEALRALESQLQRMSKQARDSFEQLEASLRDAESHHEAVSTRHREEQATFEAAQVERWRSYDAFVRAAAHPILHAASDGTLLAANPAFITMLGADSVEALLARAASLDDITPADQWRAAVEQWRGAEQSSSPVESRWKRADGAVLALLLHGRRIGGQKKADERLEVIVENVTARRALEFQLKRARRWEDVAKVTTGIAGDLQHAVAALGTSAELIAEVPADPASQAALAAVRQQATHAASLSRQLVAFGRRESREPEPLDLNDVVRGLESVLRRMADEHVELTFELGSRVDLVQADRSTVGEALVALTLAATGALPAGGTLVVRTTSQEIAVRATAPDGVEPGSYAVLTVAAAGWGLTGVDAEVGGGSVAAISQAIERSGGRLTTTVTPGQSVEFAVYLALAAEVVEV